MTTIVRIDCKSILGHKLKDTSKIDHLRSVSCWATRNDVYTDIERIQACSYASGNTVDVAESALIEMAVKDLVDDLDIPDDGQAHLVLIMPHVEHLTGELQ